MTLSVSSVAPASDRKARIARVDVYFNREPYLSLDAARGSAEFESISHGSTVPIPHRSRASNTSLRSSMNSNGNLCSLIIAILAISTDVLTSRFLSVVSY